MSESRISARQLCMRLLKADTEEAVIALLEQCGYWKNAEVWRAYGDRENNFSTMGNQSANADAALVEKIVNSVDAVLMSKCWAAGIRPNSPDAPKSIPEAVAQFFFGDATRAESMGRISRWGSRMRREVSDLITVAATGSRRNPCFTVVDCGEGQSPNSMPDTLLSLDNENKVDVHFVQGKFNMGGTGALRFCGRHNLQLVISRRNLAIKAVDPNDSSIGRWGFTIVRREDPTRTKRVSTYKYLAPDDGAVLSFDADSMPLLPKANEAYVRTMKGGTAIKLYDYKLKGRSNILRRDGLLGRLDLLLPGVALPVRLHECRDYSGHEGSFDTTLNGLNVRLSDDRAENLEPGFPVSCTFSVAGQQITAAIHAFRRGKADSYRKGEGVLFTVNGQTHGVLPRTFFSRRSVGMGRLEDSILVEVDCSQVSGRLREELFMNSRDRLQQGEFLDRIEEEIASQLKGNQLLRDLGQRRKAEDIATRLEDSKALKDVLESIVRKSPSMAALFGGTGDLSVPFRPGNKERGNGFQGKRYPSVFRFHDKDYGHILKRTTPIKMRSRIEFDTDVMNDYFTRAEYPGSRTIRSLRGRLSDRSMPDDSINLQNGIATLLIPMPRDAKVGETFGYEIAVTDETLAEPFRNQFEVTVGPEQKSSVGGRGKPKRRSDKKGQGSNEVPEGLALPDPIQVFEEDWKKYGFDKYSAMKAVHDPSEEDGEASQHSYYINMDNVYLMTELKATKENPDIVKARWQIGMVIFAMVLLREDGYQAGDDGEGAEAAVAKISTAIAPALLPLIEHLGALSDEDVAD